MTYLCEMCGFGGTIDEFITNSITFGSVMVCPECKSIESTIEHKDSKMHEANDIKKEGNQMILKLSKRNIWNA